MSLTPQQRRIIETNNEIWQNPDSQKKAFMARALVQATLPHSNPGNVPVWGRTNGYLTLKIQPDWVIEPKTSQPRCVGIPYGTIPRLLMFWLTTEAVRMKSRKLILGDSLSGFMRQLDLIPTGGRWGTIPRLKEQMNRLFRAKISFEQSYSTDSTHSHQWIDMQVAPAGEFWWDYRQPQQGSLWSSWIELGETFYEAIVAAPVPVDLRALLALKRSALALDLYAWTTYKTFVVSQKGKEQFVPWLGLMNQMGTDYKRLDNFVAKAKDALKKIELIYPNLNFFYVKGGLIIRPSRTAISMTKRK